MVKPVLKVLKEVFIREQEKILPLHLYQQSIHFMPTVLIVWPLSYSPNQSCWQSVICKVRALLGAQVYHY